MQIINLKASPVEAGDYKGLDNLFLVDVPDREFDDLMLELEDAISSYYEHVDGAWEQPVADVATAVMDNCGRHYIPITIRGTIEM